MAVAAERSVYYQTPPQQDGRKPLFYEAFVGFDISQLLLSDVWRGKDIPSGDGSSVIVIPGFGSKDLDTLVLRHWLKRIGYNGQSSGILLANTNPEYYEETIGEKVDTLAQDTNKKVHLIGHSLGGVVARLIALSRPEKIKSVTTLGSPLHGDFEQIVDPFILVAAKILIPILRDRERLNKRKKELSESLHNRGIRTTSIYTTSDGIVDWQSCVDPDPNTDNHEVSGTHAGLILNLEVYRHLGHVLNQPELQTIIDLPTFSKFAA